MLINDKKTSCILCKKKKFIKFNNNFNYINSNITVQKEKCILKLCKVCGTVQKNIDTNYLKNLSNLYKNYNIYQKFNTYDQAKFNKQGKVELRSFLIFKKIAKKLNLKKKLSILDYGSGNGNMLKPFLSKKFNFKLFACDIKNNLSKEIKNNKKFIQFLRIKKLKLIKEKFDLIILSHSLEHLIDPVNDLKLLSSKLSETGKIIVQIPDYRNNPYDLIVYDHTTHYDINSINFLSYICNLKIEKIYANVINDEFTIFFSNKKKYDKKKFKKEKFNINKIKKIELLKKNIFILKKLKSFSFLVVKSLHYGFVQLLKKKSYTFMMKIFQDLAQNLVEQS